MANETLKVTPLKEEHLKLKAKMVPFGGWLMPVQYSGIVDEHQSVRRAIGMFDISHMGQFLVRGPEAGRWLDEMLTNTVAKLEVNQGQYTFLLNETGGVIDDLILYRLAPTEYLMVVNAAKIEEDLAWLEQHQRDGVELQNRSPDFGAVAIQGPRIVAFLKKWLGGEPPPRNHLVDVRFLEQTISVARTGYTGEDGVEVFFPAMIASQLWQSALEAGREFALKPCGLGARDTLRLEMCYPLNGSDLTPLRNPLEAGLGFFVDLEKPQFLGRDKLLETKSKGLRERLIAFKMTGKSPPPRPHYAVYANDVRAGEISSGTLSPSLNIGIGMAYLSATAAKVGTPLEIEIRGQRFPAKIEKKPLYQHTP